METLAYLYEKSWSFSPEGPSFALVWRSSEPPAAMTADGHSQLILAVAVRRDRESFRTLFQYFAPRVKSYLLRRGVPPPSADELAQETLLMVWRKAERFDPSRASASTWIFTIARNLRIDHLRRGKLPGDYYVEEEFAPSAGDDYLAAE